MVRLPEQLPACQVTRLLENLVCPGSCGWREFPRWDPDAEAPGRGWGDTLPAIREGKESIAVCGEKRVSEEKSCRRISGRGRLVPTIGRGCIPAEEWGTPQSE
jgi:hypothetical protein